MSSYRDISPSQLRIWMDTEPEEVAIIDVREPFEWNIARIEPATLIPLRQLPRRTAEVPPDVRVVCLCHHGVRSATACQILAAAGHGRLYNLRGGIHAWSVEIDPDVPVY